MKGLLIKDFALMNMQRKYYIGITVMAVAFSLLLKQPGFAIGYPIFCFSSFALSSISYDEHDNGLSFIFTLPITRKTYVKEKYVFCTILSIASLIFSLLLTIAIGFYDKIFNITEALVVAPFVMIFVLLYMFLLIPIQLKFGADKLRTAIFAILGCIVGLGFIIDLMCKRLGIDLLYFFGSLFNSHITFVCIIFISSIFSTFILSYIISLRIMRSKEL